MSPGVFDGSLLSDAHPVLDFGEGLLDGIEIRRIGRQEPEPCAGCDDHLANVGRFMRAEIVHDDDIARFEHGHELLLDPSAEALAVDWPIEDARGRQSVRAQCAEEGERSPVAMRGKAAQALALRPPSAQRSHVGFDPGFVDEHQPARIEVGLEGAPAPSSSGNVGSSLLKGK